jgi:hypothetical protein
MEMVLALGQGAEKVHRVGGVLVLVDAGHLGDLRLVNPQDIVSQREIRRAEVD